MRFAGVVLACSALALFGFRGPGCGGGGDERAVGLNGPCTRARDCERGLRCFEGVCVPEDAGSADASLDVVLTVDGSDAAPDAPDGDAGLDASDAFDGDF